jgi:hypothetical protein
MSRKFRKEVLGIEAAFSRSARLEARYDTSIG